MRLKDNIASKHAIRLCLCRSDSFEPNQFSHLIVIWTYTDIRSTKVEVFMARYRVVPIRLTLLGKASTIHRPLFERFQHLRLVLRLSASLALHAQSDVGTPVPHGSSKGVTTAFEIKERKSLRRWDTHFRPLASTTPAATAPCRASCFRWTLEIFMLLLLVFGDR